MHGPPIDEQRPAIAVAVGDERRRRPASQEVADRAARHVRERDIRERDAIELHTAACNFDAERAACDRHVVEHVSATTVST